MPEPGPVGRLRPDQLVLIPVFSLAGRLQVSARVLGIVRAGPVVRVAVALTGHVAEEPGLVAGDVLVVAPEEVSGPGRVTYREASVRSLAEVSVAGLRLARGEDDS